VLSKYTSLPDDGGYGEQDALLMADLEVMQERYNVAMLKASKET
jgi:hypothetical protein